MATTYPYDPLTGTGVRPIPSLASRRIPYANNTFLSPGAGNLYGGAGGLLGGDNGASGGLGGLLGGGNLGGLSDAVGAIGDFLSPPSVSVSGGASDLIPGLTDGATVAVNNGLGVPPGVSDFFNGTTPPGIDTGGGFAIDNSQIPTGLGDFFGSTPVSSSPIYALDGAGNMTLDPILGMPTSGAEAGGLGIPNVSPGNFLDSFVTGPFGPAAPIIGAGLAAFANAIFNDAPNQQDAYGRTRTGDAFNQPFYDFGETPFTTQVQGVDSQGNQVYIDANKTGVVATPQGEVSVSPNALFTAIPQEKADAWEAYLAQQQYGNIPGAVEMFRAEKGINSRTSQAERDRLIGRPPAWFLR